MKILSNTLMPVGNPITSFSGDMLPAICYHTLMGILLAITALLSWGLGDFLIQRSVRKFGDWEALFYITAFGSVILFPFVYKDLGNALHTHAVLLWIASLVILLAALLNFEALRIGKISVIAPLDALEIPVTVLLAAYVIGERLTLQQTLLITSLMAGILLVSTRSFHHFRNIRLEKGVWYVLFATIGMGAANFLFGLGARETNPLIINWFTSVVIAAVSFAYLAWHSRLGEAAKDFKHNARLILTVSFFDNLAWVAFSAAMLYIPIAVATGISEGYIAFAAGLGILFNKERLQHHQLIGFAVTIVAVILLALVTDH